MDKSELPEKIAALIKQAEAGEAAAQFSLGLRYRHGNGVEQSDDKAVFWYRKSAEQGNAQAQTNLGWMYQTGKGIEENNQEAFNWYRKAAEQGLANAQSNLGLMYQFGNGVEQDYAEAVALFQKAADQGSHEGLCNLGWMYEAGLGVVQSDRDAVTYYRKAAEEGHARSQCNLGWMYENARGVEKNDCEAEIWYRKSAEQGFARAQCNLGILYDIGNGIEPNYGEAVSWYRKAIRQGYERAEMNLGQMYMIGRGVKKSYIRAQALFRKATRSTNTAIRFEAIECQDRAERYTLSPEITEIREEILNQLRVESTITMTHYTSLIVGNALLLEKSPLRLGHINALNDPNEGKLLWRYLCHVPVEANPVFVGCFLPEDDSLNMWRFYSKNHENDDACGCAITFNTTKFFDFNLLKELPDNAQLNELQTAFSNTGKSPQESASFYRIIYISGDMNIHGDKNKTLKKLFMKLKDEVDVFWKKTPKSDKSQKLSKLLGPLPYLLKDADYEAEKEHRVIVTHLEYGAREIQCMAPNLEKGTQPRLYLELHRENHLDPVKHVTLGPKAPHHEMMIPYWHHKLMSDFAEQLQPKKDFYIRASKCAYQ